MVIRRLLMVTVELLKEEISSMVTIKDRCIRMKRCGESSFSIELMLCFTKSYFPFSR
jgi:hypothetical protein